MTNRRLCNATAIAAMLGVTRARVYELSRLRLLPTVRLGRQVRFDPEAVEAFIGEGGSSLPGGWRMGPDTAGQP